MFVSLVIPLMNEEGNISLLWSRLQEVTQALKAHTFEVVFVDDGSTDATVQNVQSLVPMVNMRWKLLCLSRNFGHQAAVSAGMSHASGDALVFLDADLQDPPELIPVFLEQFQAGHDVVYGVRKNRKEPLWLRFCFSAFYRIFNSIAERPMPLDAGDFGLISRRVAQAIAQMPERDRLVRGMRAWVGFRQIGIPYDRPERQSGTTSYSFWRRLDGALDGLFGYSKLPIRFVFCFGLLVFLLCGGYLLYSYLGMFMTGDKGAVGWRSLITLGFMLGGANLIALAIVGEYVCRIYFQGKRRPLFVMERILESDSKP